MVPLKLTALDQEDLEVVSAHLQDAVLLVGDIKHLKRSEKFAAIANRFVWDGTERRRAHERRRAGVQFNRVKSVKTQRIAMSDPEGVLSLLGIDFTAVDGPSGVVTLTFSGGGAIRLEVECIEARLEDLGPAWETANLPSHER